MQVRFTEVTRGNSAGSNIIKSAMAPDNGIWQYYYLQYLFPNTQQYHHITSSLAVTNQPIDDMKHLRGSLYLFVILSIMLSCKNRNAFPSEEAIGELHLKTGKMI